MFYKKITFVVVITLCSTFFAQTKNEEWQIGISASIVKFSDEDASFIGDRYLFQIPRLNLTMPIGNNLSLDGAMSFNTFDVGFIENSVNYFSMDASLRYHFDVSDSFYPYIFVGTSITDSSYKITPTFNIGTGLTYWFSDTLGVNSQVYYKHSLESFESMRSHIQGSLGLVYAFKISSIFSGGNKPRGSISTSCYYNQH